MHAHARHNAFLLFGMLLTATVLVGACSGESAPAAPPDATRAVAERIVEDGAATTSSRVTVRFSRRAEIAGSGTELASSFRITPPHDIQGPQRTVEVVAATPSETSSRVIELTTSGLVSDGSTLHVSRRAFLPRGTGETSVTIESDLGEGAILLATAPLSFSDPERMTQAEVASVEDADRDEAAQRDALERHLRHRGNDEALIDETLALYDALPREIIPHPKMRAALAALRGTFAEPAISSLVTDDNCTGSPAAAVAFMVPPEYPDLVARVTYDDDGARVLSINPSVEGERFEFLMPLLAHEAIHCDFGDGLAEEVAATAFDTYLYLLLIAVNPELPGQGTLLARTFNIDAVAMLNSGRRWPESIGILPSAGIDNVLPGSNVQVESFAALVVSAYPQVTEAESAPEAVAQAYAANLAQFTAMQPGNAFDLAYLDALLGLSFPPQLLTPALAALDLEPQE